MSTVSQVVEAPEQSTKQWSDQQAAIFEWFERGHGNLVVVARAGCGKTTTIIEGINRAPEANILSCAFNKSIQEELTGRLRNPRAHAQTLHSLGFEAVRRYWPGIKVGKGSERADALTEQVCGMHAPDPVKKLVTKLHTKGREIAPHAGKVGDLTNLLYEFECEPDEEWRNEGFDVIYVEERALRAMDLAATVKPVDTGIDFADMIYLPVRNHWLNRRFDMVVVDEAQDMNIAQLEIATGVCKAGGRIVVVGDDRQAIYGFRGADSGSIARLRDELKATTLKLNTTYRCGKAIVARAAKLVPDFQAAPTAPEGAVEEMAEDKITDALQEGDFLLSRLNAPLVQHALALLKNGKRARVAGRDIGATLVTLVRKLAKGRAASSIPEFLSKLETWRYREVSRMTAAKKPELAELAEDKASMLSSIAAVATSVRDLEDRIAALFTDNELGRAGVITCSSVHRSKGLEAERVFLLQNTLYPRGRTTEEENIEYVGVTRAKSKLVLVN